MTEKFHVIAVSKTNGIVPLTCDPAHAESRDPAESMSSPSHQCPLPGETFRAPAPPSTRARPYPGSLQSWFVAAQLRAGSLWEGCCCPIAPAWTAPHGEPGRGLCRRQGPWELEASTAEPRNHPSVLCVWVLCGSAHELCIKQGALRGGPESHWCSGPWPSSFSPWPQVPRGVLQPR
ncbi:uncharacterized protein LOC111174800 [Delphinapterus leucas]|uniref:Uncharacterized protein LOC111174800 n=1 Tax=Delphinapterus leucas TaxID=9749 RepID=A0A7F8KEY2_DELLE|nr:uncharacterized protein LOC111174800 [Delphinapterus leucas]